MTHSLPVYSVVIPTFRRPDQLLDCLESVCALDYPRDRLEVIVVDNGGPAENVAHVSESFIGRLSVRHLVNERNQGYGFSVNRGILEARGDRILLLNDDARPAPNLLQECETLLRSDPAIGCVGCRAIEEGYRNSGEGVGRLDPSGEVVGNFNLDCGEPIEVEHVYGFCYVFTREAVVRAGGMDTVLLARPYSSGNRIETDHCLNIRRAGLKVVYNPRMVALHLAKPRPDMSEVSARWKINAIRNTIYLYLKHFGPFGRGGAALRLTFVSDVGVLSAIRCPTWRNILYFLVGLRARASAWWHWFRYLRAVGPGARPVRAVAVRAPGR